MKITPTALATAVLFLHISLPAHAADTPPPRRALTPDDFYNMQIVTEPQVSPDGKWVAYVVSTNDRGADEERSAVWMVSWDGTQQIPLTNPAHDISSPRWSLDGRYVSYMAIPTGTDKTQIMLLDRRGGEARALTAVTDDIESYEWSPDSKRLVLVMEQGNAKARRRIPPRRQQMSPSLSSSTRCISRRIRTVTWVLDTTVTCICSMLRPGKSSR